MYTNMTWAGRIKLYNSYARGSDDTVAERLRPCSFFIYLFSPELSSTARKGEKAVKSNLSGFVYSLNTASIPDRFFFSPLLFDPRVRLTRSVLYDGRRVIYRSLSARRCLFLSVTGVNLHPLLLGNI